MAPASRSVIAATRSSGSVRLTPTRSSINSAGTAGRGVGQSVDGAAAEPPAGDADEHGNDESGGGIGPGVAQRHAAEPDQNRDRRPHIGRKMQRVGFQRFARCLPGNAIECPRPKEIDDDRADDDGKSRHRRLDRMRCGAGEPLQGFPHHHARKQE